MPERRARPPRWAAWAAALAIGAAQAQPDWRLSGYYKNLLVRSRTAQGEPFTLDLNRLRLEMKAALPPAVALDLQYDNELLLGNYLRTSQFQQQKDVPARQFWRAEANYMERSDAYGRHRLYRATANVAAGAFDVRIGRQRIPWGTGRFWSPLDLLNPVNPIALEREDRPGVDAVLVERKLGPVSRWSAVYAPQRVAALSSRALQWHGNARGIDYSIVGGRLLGEEVAGLDVAGQLGQTGVRAELTINRKPGLPTYTRLMAGIDHAFANTLTLSAEAYYNGAGASAPSGYDFPALLSGEKQALARRYAGVSASYEVTPLLKWDGTVVLNLADRSRYVASRLSLSLGPDLDLTIGLQQFSGEAGTEYQRLRNTRHVALQRFF
jgi:hypothetical protein